MNMVVGNGTFSGTTPVSGEFIHIAEHGTMSIQNTNSEGYKRSLLINGLSSFKSYPIELINNVLPACPVTIDSVATSSVLINNATVYSHSNFYPCFDTGAHYLTRPEITGFSEVYSTGDKFCLDASAKCFEDSSGLRSEFALKSNTAILRSDHQMDLGSSDVDWAKPAFEINSSWCCGGDLGDNSPVVVFKPLLSLTQSLYSGGTFYRYMYTFTRNARSGRLEIKGSDSTNKTGYYFKNGPVQLETTTAGNLSTYNTASAYEPDSGSLMFCSDCVAGSTPCAGSGGGALALKVGSAWHCK